MIEKSNIKSEKISKRLLQIRLNELFDAGKHNAFNSTGEMMVADILNWLENKGVKFK